MRGSQFARDGEEVLISSSSFLFIHIPKTGGTSIESALGGLGHVKRGRKGRHITAYGARGTKRFDDVFKFCFVRNPYDRLVSWFLHSGCCDFAKFVMDLDLTKDGSKPQVDYVFHDGECLLDFVGRFERIDADFKHVLERLNIKDVVLPRLNSRRHQSDRDWRQFYTEELFEVVSWYYRQDIEAFGYDISFRK